MKQSLVIIAALMLVVLGTAMLSLRGPEPAPVKHYALLIEVSEYETDSLKDLKHPRKETEALAQELRAQYGFTVDILNSPTGKDILNKFDKLYDSYGNGKLDPTGQLIISLSGHGLFDKKSQSGFFLPADYDPDVLDLTALPYDLWRKKINALPCKHIFLVLDACYSGTFDNDIAMRGTIGKFKPRRPGSLSDVDKILAEHEERKTRVFVSSGLKEQTPDKSQLSYQLLNGLRRGAKDQGLITLDEIYNDYLKSASPTPLFKSFGDDDPGSHFLFINGGKIDPEVDKTEEELWRWVSANPKRGGYKFYLEEYPDGHYAPDARNYLSEYIIDLNVKSPKTIYVNQNNTKNGSGEDWNESVRDLRYALAIAEPGDKMWVAAGTYLPSYSGDRNKSFEIGEGIELYGGFSGDEVVFSERNFQKNKTILSGNIGNTNSDNDNAYSVIYTENIGDDVIVDGVTISDGFAKNFKEGIGRGSSGGGWLNLADGGESSPTIVNVQFTGNLGHHGGGMMNIVLEGGVSNSVYRNTTWRNNHADFKGGALYNFSRGGTCRSIIKGSEFINNGANTGSAITNDASLSGIISPLIFSCTFTNNTSTSNGAAIYNITDGTGEVQPILEETSFTGNSAILGDDVGGGSVSVTIDSLVRRNIGRSLSPKRKN